jgi:hypothetical protein
MKARRDAESVTPQQSNLNFHRELKVQMFEDLDAETRARFEAQAVSHNKTLEEGPGDEHIYKYVRPLTFILMRLTSFDRNQRSIIDGVSSALHRLCGHSWGQYGDVVFFLQGAYRDEQGHLKTFKYVSA